MTKSNPRTVGGPIKIPDVVITGGQFARLTFTVCVLLNGKDIQTYQLEVFINPTKVILRFVVLFFLITFWISYCKGNPISIGRPFGVGRRFVAKCNLHVLFGSDSGHPNLTHKLALFWRSHGLGDGVDDSLTIGR